MEHKNLLSVITLCLLVWSASSKAAPIPSFDEANFGIDRDGNGLFTVTDLQINLELLDAPTQFAGSMAEFGFYDSLDPNTLVTIFDSADQNPGDSTPTALVYFDSGVVVDADDGSSIQSIFATGTTEIGYYLKLESDFAAALSIDEILYSQPSLNLGGMDYFAAFPLLIDDVPAGSIAPAFFYFNPDAQPLYVAAAINLGEPLAVYEPQMLLMFGTGLIGLAVTRRRRRSRQ